MPSKINFPLLRALSNRAPIHLSPQEEAAVLQEWSRLLVDSFRHFTLPGLSNTMLCSHRQRDTWKYISYWNPKFVCDPMTEFTMHIQGIYEIRLYGKAYQPTGRFVRNGWCLSRDGHWWHIKVTCVLRAVEAGCWEMLAEAPTTIRVTESTPAKLMRTAGLSVRAFHSVLSSQVRTWAERAQVRYDESTKLLANLEAIGQVI